MRVYCPTRFDWRLEQSWLASPSFQSDMYKIALESSSWNLDRKWPQSPTLLIGISCISGRKRKGPFGVTSNYKFLSFLKEKRDSKKDVVLKYESRRGPWWSPSVSGTKTGSWGTRRADEITEDLGDPHSSSPPLLGLTDSINIQMYCLNRVSGELQEHISAHILARFVGKYNPDLVFNH
ncbi:hypothetical protein J6590_047700 [Homalodisca vitripennis]|nr:hypothetical protein J6590_047700 [Homalodisca vitripennis]